MAALAGSVDSRSPSGSDSRVDLPAYRSYGWRASPVSAAPATPPEVEQAIDRELRRAGLERVGAEAELWVVVQLALDGPLAIRADELVYGGWPGWRG
ncbi:MAG TPA: DUF4136 domain-containing protein, partial [Candidatus Polarisedimenticolaceae bacterium]|nr:DUF4136 domain-containing protein [Candidatus Polarisedimenticolaceae bacterium]